MARQGDPQQQQLRVHQPTINCDAAPSSKIVFDPHRTISTMNHHKKKIPINYIDETNLKTHYQYNQGTSRSMVEPTSDKADQKGTIFNMRPSLPSWKWREKQNCQQFSNCLPCTQPMLNHVFFPFKVDPFSKRGKNHLDTFKNVCIHLNA